MNTKKLKHGYRNNNKFYIDFINKDLSLYGDTYISSSDIYDINTNSKFPIYMGTEYKLDKKNDFLNLINTIENNFANLDKGILLDENFWHSYICIYMREYLFDMYPYILRSQKSFENIVTKKFDWENYIYKAVLAVEYVSEHVEEDSKSRYYELIFDNMDLYNYIIKYEIFRNSNFLVNFLDIAVETNTLKILKEQIKDRPDLGKDERYGRRVVYEFNKSYPVVMSPMLDKEELKVYFLKFLGYYKKDL